MIRGIEQNGLNPSLKHYETLFYRRFTCADNAVKKGLQIKTIFSTLIRTGVLYVGHNNRVPDPDPRLGFGSGFSLKIQI